MLLLRALLVLDEASSVPVGSRRHAREDAVDVSTSLGAQGKNWLTDGLAVGNQRKPCRQSFPGAELPSVHGCIEGRK